MKYNKYYYFINIKNIKFCQESVEMVEYAARLAHARNETGREGGGGGGGGERREGCGDKSAKRYPNQTETIRYCGKGEGFD